MNYRTGLNLPSLLNGRSPNKKRRVHSRRLSSKILKQTRYREKLECEKIQWRITQSRISEPATNGHEWLRHTFSYYFQSGSLSLLLLLLWFTKLFTVGWLQISCHQDSGYDIIYFISEQKHLVPVVGRDPDQAVLFYFVQCTKMPKIRSRTYFYVTKTKLEPKREKRYAKIVKWP